MHRVRRFGVVQTANMAAMMYFVMSILFILPFIFLASLLPDMSDLSDNGTGGFGMSRGFGMSSVFLFFIPPLYAAMGWVATAIMCWFYNMVAGFVGGIAVELQPED